MTRLINADGRDVTAETIASLRKVMAGGDLAKAETVTLASGLVAYDLEAPAKNLYPVLTPLRNRIPRSTRGAGAGIGPNWRAVTAIRGGGVISMPWIPEGQRAARMSIDTETKSATYRTIGLETDVTFEAQSAGEGFEDVLATAGMRLLQQTMILEELAILGGNRSVSLGKPVTPTTAVVTDAASTLENDTYLVSVVPLTLEGYLAASLSGIVQQASITGMDGKAYTLNGGSGIVSDAKSQAMGGTGKALTAYTTPIKGAVAYAWYVGKSGAQKLEQITTINSVYVSSLLGTGQALSDLTTATDYSKNESVAFDGLLYTAFNSALAYYTAQATGTAGTGTPLTSSGHGSITEIDTMFESFWNNYKISPDELYVSSQELKNITNKVLYNSSSAPLMRFNLDANQTDPTFVAGQVVGYYFNQFSMSGGQIVPIRLHPNLPKGTLFAWTQNLPAYYQSANVPQVAEVQCRRDYYQIPWPLHTRANETGVYAEEVLKVYAPFAIGVITNIGNG